MPSSSAKPSMARVQTDEAATLRTLNTFAVDLIGIPSAEDLYWYVAQNVVGRLNFVDCVIYQANEDQTDLHQVAAWGEKNPFGRDIINPLAIPFGRGITGQVAQTRRAVVIDDLLKDRNYIPDTQIARSEICVPLMSQGRVVGVIDSEHPDPHAFGAAELEILSTVAAMTSAKLELLAEAERSAQRYRDLVASHDQLTREISTRKALEAKLYEARKLESIGRLTGRFAHEFNNILTVILGNLELLGDAALTADSRTCLDEAMTAGDRASRLMRDMLAFAQRTRLAPSDCDLNALITGLGHTRGVRLDLTSPLWPVRVDVKAIEGVLMNLLDNARDAISGGGEIRILTENIHHHQSGDLAGRAELPPGRYVRVCMSDTGTGIAPDVMPQIFDPFFTTKSVGSGTGLGLAMVRGVAQQSGGTVVATSDPGQGTSIHLYLPSSG